MPAWVFDVVVTIGKNSAHDVPVFRLVRHGLRKHDLVALLVVTRLTRRNDVGPIGLTALAGRHNVVQREITIIERLVTVSTSVEVTQVNTLTAETHPFLILHVFLGHGQGRHRKAALAGVNIPIVVVFEDCDTVKEMQTHGLLPRNGAQWQEAKWSVVSVKDQCVAHDVFSSV